MHASHLSRLFGDHLPSHQEQQDFYEHLQRALQVQCPYLDLVYQEARKLSQNEKVMQLGD